MAKTMTLIFKERGRKITNGDVIKVLFPDYCIEEGKYTVWVGRGVTAFSKEWWDKPYKGGNIDGKSNS